MKSVYCALRPRRHVRAAVFCSVLALSLSLGVGLFHQRITPLKQSPYTPRLTAAQVSQRSLSFCTRFSDTARLLEEPRFHDEQFITPAGPRHRPVWTALCEADGKRCYVQFNDFTGNLIGLMPERGGAVPAATGIADSTIKTSSQAARVAISRIAELQLVPSGTHIALESNPQLVSLGRAWEMVWKAQPPAHKRPYEIKLVLARASGVPLRAINRRELAQYTID